MLSIHPSQSQTGAQAPLGNPPRKILVGYEQRHDDGNVTTERACTYGPTKRRALADDETWTGWVKMPDVLETGNELIELGIVMD